MNSWEAIETLARLLKHPVEELADASTMRVMTFEAEAWRKGGEALDAFIVYREWWHRKVHGELIGKR
jgi:hypothetical protein